MSKSVVSTRSVKVVRILLLLVLPVADSVWTRLNNYKECIMHYLQKHELVIFVDREFFEESVL